MNSVLRLAVDSLSLRLFLARVLLFLKRTVKEECLLILIKREEIREIYYSVH
jgi:hypothetical protein